MIRSIFPIIFTVTTLLLFFSVISPFYEDAVLLRGEEKKLDEALSTSMELQSVRDRLITKYNSISTENLDRLLKLLPEKVDDVRFVLDIQNIARAHGIELSDISVEREDEPDEFGGGVIEEGNGKPYNSVTLTFGAKISYDNLLLFLADVEQSLRIIDITKLSVISDGGILDYQISLRTYWLK